MTADQPWSHNSGFPPRPDERSRLIVDDRGVEWEVYDEATWSIGLALEWDYLPQIENPGLVFVSRIDRRRFWPCPANWSALSVNGYREQGRAPSLGTGRVIVQDTPRMFRTPVSR